MVCNRHNIHQEALLQITRPLESLAGFPSQLSHQSLRFKTRSPGALGRGCFPLPWGLLLHEILHQHDQDVVPV